MPRWLLLQLRNLVSQLLVINPSERLPISKVVQVAREQVELFSQQQQQSRPSTGAEGQAAGTSASGTTVTSSASASSAVQEAENLIEKLKLLDYETNFCRVKYAALCVPCLALPLLSLVQGEVCLLGLYAHV